MSSQQTKSQVLEKGLWGMSFPIMIEYGMNMSIPLIDAFFLSKISDAAAAAAGAALPVIFLFNVFFSTVATSGAGVASQLMGAGNYHKARITFTINFYICILVGLFAFVIFQTSSQYVAQLMGLTGEMQDLFTTYLLWLGSGVGFMGLRQVMHAINNAYGQPKWNNLSALIVVSSNIIFNAAIVYDWFGLGRYGIRGIAFASLLATIIAFLVLLIILIYKVNVKLPLRFALKDFKTITKAVLRIAAPSSLEPISYQLSLITISSIVAGISVSQLALRIYSFNIFLLCMIPTMAIGIATQMITAQLIGKANYSHAHEQMLRSVKSSVQIALACAVLLLILHQPIIKLFTQDPEILSMAFMVFLPYAIMESFRAINVVVGVSLRAAGDAMYIVTVSSGVTWLIAIPLAWWASQHWGLIGVMWALIFDEGLRAGVNLHRWFQNRWRKQLISA